MAHSSQHRVPRARFFALAALLSLASLAPAHAAGINLSWDDCGANGASSKTFACNVNAGAPFTLIGSFVPPAGIQEFLGISATLYITTPDDLPDWWKHGAGFCRGTMALATQFDFTGGPFNCVDFYEGAAAGGYAYDVGFEAANRARLRIQAAIPFGNRGPLSETDEYYAFKALILRSKSTGSGACVGCDVPASIELAEIQLFQPVEVGNDPVLTTPLDGTVVAWQAELGDLPVVDSLTPMAGPVGTSVTVQGSRFTGTVQVRFGTIDAPFIVDSDAQIRTTVPNDALTAPIIVRNADGTGRSDSMFIVAPDLQSFGPTQAPVGHTITIVGRNFLRTTSVTFNGTASGFEIVSNTVIEAVVPPAATDGPITVTNPGGSDSSDQPFTIGPVPAPPSITSFTPTAGPEGIEVTLTGERFTRASLVRFRGVEAGFTVDSDTEIRATVPTDALTGTIDVTTPNGTGTSSSAFIVAPKILDFSPRRALIGDFVFLYGRNFTGTTSVRFNGAAAEFTVQTESQIRTRVPSGATNGPITATNPGGTAATPEDFRVGPSPISGINLSWDDCGTLGTMVKAFACNTNEGAPFSLIGSFIPPAGISEFVGLSADLTLKTNPELLPDWWKHGSGQCRGNSGLSSSFDFTSFGGCTDFFGGQGSGGHLYEVGFYGPNSARLRVQGAVPLDNRGPLEPEQEFYAFKVLITRSQATGSSSCINCHTPVCILLNEIQLFQVPEQGYDPQIQNPIDRNFVAWQARRTDCPLPTATLAHAISIGFDDGVVRVAWSTQDVERARIQRREGAGEWQLLATVVPDGSRRVAYEDAAIVAGRSYTYRLGVSGPGGEVFLGEISIDVPAIAASLALSNVVSDSDGLAVSFSLASTAPAKLDVYDVGGRRRITHALSGLTAGEHRASVAGARRLESGVYFARLGQGKHQVTRRFLITR